MKNNAAPSIAGQCPASVTALSELEFIFITGKGGVGKSTSAALLGLCAGELGKKVLVIYPGDENDPGRSWEKKLSEEPSHVAPGVDAVIVRSESAIRQYLSDVLGSQKLAALLLHGKIARGLITGIPGPSNWAILGKAWSWTRSSTFRLPPGQSPYDLVILDAPSSGDGSGMLRIPKVIMDLAPAARLRSDAASCLQVLQDPKKSAVVFVTLPEEVVIVETEENLELVRNNLCLPLGPLLINQVLSPIFSPEDREILCQMHSRARNSNNERQNRCWEVAQHRARRESLQAQHLERIAALGLPTLSLPYIDDRFSGILALRKLKMGLAEGP